MAAAEVTIGGLGRFGVHYSEANKDKPEGDTNLESRLRLQIDMSTQSDAGIELGGRFRAQYDDDPKITRHPVVKDDAVEPGMDQSAQAAAKWSGGRLHAAMGPVTLYVGNVGDAVDAMPGLYLPTTSVGTGVGYQDAGLVVSGVSGFSSNGAGVTNGVQLTYSMGDFGLQVNSSDDHINRQVSAHVSYKIGGWQIAIAGLDNDQENKGNIVAGTITGDLGFAKVGAALGRNEEIGQNAGDRDKIRVYGAVPIGMASQIVVWGADEDMNKAETTDGGSFGVDVQHDLGGNVFAVAGYSDSANVDGKGAQASAGIFFKF